MKQEENTITDTNVKTVAVGIDRGGTWTRISAYGPAFETINSARFPSGPMKELPGQINGAVKDWNIGNAPVVIGAKGAMTDPGIGEFLAGELEGGINLVKVISDAEAAHRAAFRGKAGFLLITGTGSVLLHGTPPDFIKEGGFNPKEGDPGSGRWIGRRYLKLTGKGTLLAGMSDRESASYAAEVIKKAENGDPQCVKITESAYAELLALIISAAKKYDDLLSAQIAFTGGLSESGYFFDGLQKYAEKNVIDRKITFFRPRMPSEEAAARLALELGGDIK